MIPRVLSVFSAFLVFVSCLAAQDARTVYEPLFPPVCATLDAQLHTDGRTLAPGDEQKLDTARIQHAIDHCGKGRAVMLHVDEEKNAFLSGPLKMRPDVALIVDLGVTLFASRDPALYAISPGSCGVVNDAPQGCKPLISVDHAPHSAIMGDGVIDGRGGEKMLGSQQSWWDLAEQARSGGRQQVPRLIVADHSDDFTLYRITLRNSPNFHVTYDHGDGFTVWGLKIDTPQRLARNTDGVDPGDGARNVTITHSYIRTGDDNVAIKGGAGGATNITVSDDHFYWGHGMSIGSETNGGASAIRVTDLSMDGGDNAIRIKSNASRGGLVRDILYEDVCIRDVTNPILMDTHYTPLGSRADLIPVFQDITLRNVRLLGGGRITLDGFDAAHPLGMIFDNVTAAVPSDLTVAASHARLAFGPGPVNLRVSGEDVIVSGAPGNGAPNACVNKFVPYPGQ